MTPKKLTFHPAQFGVDNVLLVISLVIYLFTRLAMLSQYPIYFFTDEAAQTLLAQDLIRNGGVGNDGSFLPTFFFNGYQYNLGVSVYLQILPALFFERSVFITRAVSALTSVLAPLAVGLLFRRVFGLRHAWAPVLLISVTPAWFLHSRTAFETVIAVSFYAVAIYAYFEYRVNLRPAALYGAVAAAGLAFYSYNPARVVVALTALLLFVSDLRFHRQHWRQTGAAIVLIGLFALPFLRFEQRYPGSSIQHLIQLESYLVQDAPAAAKLGQFMQNYASSLNPVYWFAPNQDMVRHIMPGFGHLLRWSWPLLIVGLGLALKNLHSSVYRGILLVLLAAPAGAALVGVGITGLLFLVIPAVVLSALPVSLGVSWLEQKLSRRPARLAGPLVWLTLAGFNLWLFYSAVVAGPLWEQNYGMTGMQWGGQQTAAVIRQKLQLNPQRKILYTSTWANGADTLARYFLGDPLPITPGNVDTMLNEYRPELQDVLFMMTPEEFELARSHPKIDEVRVETQVPYPNGQPGFYFCTLRYGPQAEMLFAEEKAARSVLQEAGLEIDGRLVEVRYSYLDMGSIEMIFDGNEHTLLRTWEANPLQVYLNFPTAMTLQRVGLRVGGEALRIQLRVLDPQGQEAAVWARDLPAVNDPRREEFEFPAVEAGGLELQVENLGQGQPAHVHLWELSYQ